MNGHTSLKLKVWGALLVVFVLGSVTGIGLDRYYRSRADNSVRAPSIKDSDAYFLVLDRELRLSPEQADQIAAILEETRGQYKSICAEVRPRYDHLKDDARMRMRAVLAGDQLATFD